MKWTKEMDKAKLTLNWWRRKEPIQKIVAEDGTWIPNPDHQVPEHVTQALVLLQQWEDRPISERGEQ